MAKITISHDHESGTILTGSEKGDGVWEIASAAGFRYSSQVGIYIRGSRDRVAKRHVIAAVAEALRAEGHEVTVEINDEHRPRAVVLADQAERLDDRREALTGKAGKIAAEVEGLRERSYALVEHIPLGQPILVGHHSEGAHRRRLEKSANLAIKAAYRADDARAAEARASAVGGNAAYAESPHATALRIPRLEAEARGIQRELDGYTSPRDGFTHKPAEGDRAESLWARLRQVHDQLKHDRMIIGRAIEAGTYQAWNRDNVQVGDLVSSESRGSTWRKVVKVNAKTVAVKTGYSWTDKIRYEQIRRHHRPNADTTEA